MNIVIEILYMNGHVQYIEDTVESEDDILQLQKTFADNIVQLKSSNGEFIFYRPSQVASIKVRPSQQKSMNTSIEDELDPFDDNEIYDGPEFDNDDAIIDTTEEPIKEDIIEDVITDEV